MLVMYIDGETKEDRIVVSCASCVNNLFPPETRFHMVTPLTESLAKENFGTTGGLKCSKCGSGISIKPVVAK